jgi:aspartate ammonia-lyase
MENKRNSREEHDLLGYREIPNNSLYGIQTQRAKENFNITGITIGTCPELIKAFLIVKKSAAQANKKTGYLNATIADAISAACDSLMEGDHSEHFPVDMIQGGAGTSTNMNFNEVIANKALEILGHQYGEYEFCHPNNHVNMSQSTNDAYPTALKVAMVFAKDPLIKELKLLIESMVKKAEEFKNVLKMGRTQLQDAVPMTLGQTFSSYATTLKKEVDLIESSATQFLEVNMGGTAIGTCINTSPKYTPYVVGYLAEFSHLDIVKAEDLIEATQDMGAFVSFSSALKRLAIKLSRICNDLRLLSSGPRAGFNEINLPSAQPGSSIMPGKINPVIPEVVNQVAFKVLGNDLTVSLAAEAGQLELNAFEPVIASSIFESIKILENGIETLRERCIDGITANETLCLNSVRNSLGILTALSPYLGYEECSDLSKEALTNNRNILDLIRERNLIPQDQLSVLLEPKNLIQAQLKDN